MPASLKQKYEKIYLSEAAGSFALLRHNDRSLHLPRCRYDQEPYRLRKRNAWAPLSKRRGACSAGIEMKRLEHRIEKTIRRLQSEPLLLILVAMFFMGGMMKRVKRSLPVWSVKAL